MKDNKETMREIRRMEVERMLQEQAEVRRKIIACMDDRTKLKYVMQSCARIETELSKIEAERSEA